ncbi:MAG: Uma2 family endonuclease [Leptolyngbyaceae bacterium]|nr:Uma2 family endonuclease [Leptolyngbyaceae bacterium]
MFGAPQPLSMTAQDYLEWESHQALRYEYCEGQVLAMTGGTKGHNRLALNLYSILVERVDAEGCEINVSDVKVELGKGLSYRYPDLIVSCDERDQNEPTLYRYPKLIVEVLSPSTKTVDREDKFQDYIQLPTLAEYVLISTERMQVECYRRGEGNMGLYFPYKAGDRVSIASLEIEFPIEHLYKNVQLENEP